MEAHYEVLRQTAKRIYAAAEPLQQFLASPPSLKHKDVFLEIASGQLLEEGRSFKDIADIMYEYSVKIFSFLRDGKRNKQLSEISDEMLDFDRCKYIYENATHIDIRILLRGGITVLVLRFITFNMEHAPHVA